MTKRSDRASNEPAAPAVHTPEPKSSATVTVACKIPNGIVLQLCKKTAYWEDTPSGARERERWDKTGQRLFVQGPARPAGVAPEGYGDPPPMAGGYALTIIPREFWDAWLEQNAKADFVLNGQVFARPTFDAAQGFARENNNVRSGFEPIARDLDYTKDPRLPRPVQGIGVDKVTQGDRAA